MEEKGEGRGADFSRDDVESEVLPVSVCLFESVDLWVALGTDGWQLPYWSWMVAGGSLTSLSVQTRIRSRSRFRRICKAGTW